MMIFTGMTFCAFLIDYDGFVTCIMKGTIVGAFLFPLLNSEYGD